ncbi:hypothetical protein FB451DRAFT_1170713 [Mycena latifolia]|nr:hypothetical protein FB451DRAFT_1170713 [Mycena latifolia]
MPRLFKAKYEAVKIYPGLCCALCTVTLYAPNDYHRGEDDESKQNKLWTVHEGRLNGIHINCLAKNQAIQNRPDAKVEKHLSIRLARQHLAQYCPHMNGAAAPLLPVLIPERSATTDSVRVTVVCSQPNHEEAGVHTHQGATTIEYDKGGIGCSPNTASLLDTALTRPLAIDRALQYVPHLRALAGCHVAYVLQNKEVFDCTRRDAEATQKAAEARHDARNGDIYVCEYRSTVLISENRKQPNALCHPETKWYLAVLGQQ